MASVFDFDPALLRLNSVTSSQVLQLILEPHRHCLLDLGLSLYVYLYLKIIVTLMATNWALVPVATTMSMHFPHTSDAEGMLAWQFARLYDLSCADKAVVL